MRYLGIDYGTKRIGLAISDTEGNFAFPKKIVGLGAEALSEIIALISTESVEKIIVGNSLDTTGKRNAIMEDVDVFIEELHRLTGLPIELSDERFSSSAIKSFDWKKPIANTRTNHQSKEPIDDRAAAIMLQRYLDKQH